MNAALDHEIPRLDQRQPRLGAGLLIAGYEIPHLHVHVWPSTSLADFDLARVDNAPDPADLDDAAARLRAALRDLGHGEVVPQD